MKKKKKSTIYLFWHKHNEKHGNFGDELNLYLFEKLFEDTYQIVHTPGHYLLKNRSNLLRLIFRLVRAQHYKNFKQFTESIELNLLFNKITIAIGSVIHVHSARNCQVWGAGIMRKNDRIKPAKFLAVRGYRTLERLKQLSLIAHNIPVGDPAVLLPLVYKPNIEGGKIGLIPHHVQFEGTKSKYSHLSNVLIIDLLDPIEKVINEICSCEYTLSSSLHGIIVSHAYHINSIWCDFDSNKVHGDNIKYYDYFSSLDIEPYEVISSEDKIKKLISEGFSEKFMPTEGKIEYMQQQLLKSAPFELKEKIKKLVN